ncbi:RNB domain-containing ribonuclease [Prochlorococcus sp. MIT 1307]|uniref:RNB domain-containing ribonuclease n=1 Tax=Prochlorococcus sp. MIT 1307 TaxID=3096219 RepID=UPI002A750D08|nr:RNB domain-containing ribonuclease [Prochlorococcus sp. MIT 1307]
MFSSAKLLEQLSVEKAQEQKKIEKILKLSKKNDRQKLEIAVQAFTKLGIIQKSDEGLLRVANSSFLEARLRCSSKGYCFAVREDGAGEDIYIRDQFLNQAWNGDRVLVTISREAVRRRSPEGIVHCILERSTSNLLSILELEEGNLIATPLDDRILSTIQLKESDITFYEESNKENLVEVEIDKYPIAQYDPVGHVVRPLPLDGGSKGDIDILLTKNGLQNETLSPRSTIKNPTDKNRRDLTSQPSLLLRSWGGNDSPPLPALYVEPNAGGVKLWVHIPSIAERVSLGNNLDHWLFTRSEAHCLGEIWNPLLSKNLTKACKFEPGINNKAITIELDITAQGEINDWEFYLSEIRPVAIINKLHLESLQSRKPKSRATPVALKSIKDHLVQLQTTIFCAKLILNDEKNRGLIELDLPSPEIGNLEELSNQNPESEIEQWKLPFNECDPQSVLAPILRAANRAWYNHIVALKLPGITIQSDNVDTGTLTDVAKSAIALDLKLELDEEGIPSASELSKAFVNNKSRRVLDKLLSHALPMPVLVAFNPTFKDITDSIVPDGKSNNPLITRDIQAPICCPGLHYYDIINQHILINLLKEGKARPTNRIKTSVKLGRKNCQNEINWPILNETLVSLHNNITSEKIINYLNIQHKKAKTLRNGLISMSQARSAEPFIGEMKEAVISGVQSYGFFAEIKPTMAEGLVHVSSLNDDWYEYRSRQSRLVGRKSKKIYQLGDVLNVKVIKIDILRNQIDLEAYETEGEDPDNNLEPNSIISDDKSISETIIED